MRQKSVPEKEPATQVVKNIRRATRRHFSAEDKIRIVLEGLRGEDSIAELCRREGIVQNLYYRWSKDFLEAGKKPLAGDTARAATSDEVKDLRRETNALKEVVAELTLENRLLKKSVTAMGSLRSSGSSRSPPCRCGGRWKRLAFRAPPSTAGTICTRPVGRKPWTTDIPNQIASGTAFQTMFASASSSWRWKSPPCRRGNWPCGSPTPKAILSRRLRSIGYSRPTI
jgi:transposase